MIQYTEKLERECKKVKVLYHLKENGIKRHRLEASHIKGAK